MREDQLIPFIRSDWMEKDPHLTSPHLTALEPQTFLCFRLWSFGAVFVRAVWSLPLSLEQGCRFLHVGGKDRSRSGFGVRQTVWWNRAELRKCSFSPWACYRADDMKMMFSCRKETNTAVSRYSIRVWVFAMKTQYFITLNAVNCSHPSWNTEEKIIWSRYFSFCFLAGTDFWCKLKKKKKWGGGSLHI